LEEATDHIMVAGWDSGQETNLWKANIFCVWAGRQSNLVKWQVNGKTLAKGETWKDSTYSYELLELVIQLDQSRLFATFLPSGKPDPSQAGGFQQLGCLDYRITNIASHTSFLLELKNSCTDPLPLAVTWTWVTR